MTTYHKQLLAWRDDAFAHIARNLRPPTSRHHVRYVARGERISPRIEKAIQKALRTGRFP